MQINIHAVPDGGLDLADEISASELGLDPEEFDVVGNCHLSIQVRKVGTGFHVRGRARVTVAQACARCLQAIERTVEPEIQMVFEPAGAAHTRTEEQVRRLDLGITFFQGNGIDLGPEVRQAVSLALPLKPLCRDDCKGLCPGCGVNLNVEPCRCCKEPGPRAAGSTLDDLLKKWGGRGHAR